MVGRMLKTNFLQKELKNPTVLASGILGISASSWLNAAGKGAGAITTKSIGLKERKGHKAPVLVELESGFLNAVGLSCPGIEESIEEIKEYKKKCKIPLIASVFAEKTEEFGEVCSAVSEAKPDFIELNISCPNVESEFGIPFGANVENAAKATEIAKNSCKIPLIVKLSPNVLNIAEIAEAAEKAGADAINAINTLGPGMSIDLKAKKPILSNKKGGVSGKAIKPIAIRCVFDIFEKVEIPVIGTGGITTGEDAVEIMMAGATLVGIGTAVYYRGINVFEKISKEIEEFMKKNGYKSVKELVGIAHE